MTDMNDQEPNELIGKIAAEAPPRGWCFQLVSRRAVRPLENDFDIIKRFEPGVQNTTLLICKHRVVVFAAELGRFSFTQAMQELGPALERLNKLEIKENDL